MDIANTMRSISKIQIWLLSLKLGCFDSIFCIYHDFCLCGPLHVLGQLSSYIVKVNSLIPPVMMLVRPVVNFKLYIQFCTNLYIYVFGNFGSSAKCYLLNIVSLFNWAILYYLSKLVPLCTKYGRPAGPLIRHVRLSRKLKQVKVRLLENNLHAYLVP